MGGTGRATLAAVLMALVVTAGCSAGGETQSVGPDAAVAPEMAPGRAGGGGEQVGGAADAGVGAASLEAIAGARMIVRNAEMELVVRDGSEAFGSIRALAQRVGGFIANADLTQPEGSPTSQLRGTVVMRVPAERLDAVLAELGRLAVETPTTRISTQDVTEQMVDLDARLANLRMLEAELQELLAEIRAAGERNIEQLFTVFERMRQVRDQIEQLEGRKRALEQQLALSTVTVRLEPRPAAVAAPWQPEAVAQRAAAALLGALRVVGGVVIWLAVFALPFALVLILPVALVLAAWRWRRRAPTPAP